MPRQYMSKQAALKQRVERKAIKKDAFNRSTPIPPNSAHKRQLADPLGANTSSANPQQFAMLQNKDMEDLKSLEQSFSLSLHEEDKSMLKISELLHQVFIESLKLEEFQRVSQSFVHPINLAKMKVGQAPIPDDYAERERQRRKIFWRNEKSLLSSSLIMRLIDFRRANKLPPPQFFSEVDFCVGKQEEEDFPNKLPTAAQENSAMHHPTHPHINQNRLEDAYDSSDNDDDFASTQARPPVKQLESAFWAKVEAITDDEETPEKQQHVVRKDPSPSPCSSNGCSSTMVDVVKAFDTPDDFVNSLFEESPPKCQRIVIDGDIPFEELEKSLFK